MERPHSPSATVLLLSLVWLLRGVDLQHSDLAIQRTLSSVRRDPGAFPGDLVADAAAHHPGIWLDLLALLPDRPLVLGLLGMGIPALAGLLAYRLVRMLGGSVRLAAVMVLFLALPRVLPGVVELLPAAPISRAAAIPLVLASFWAVVHDRPVWAGFWAGLVVSVHPAVGAGAVVVVGGWSARRVATLGGVVLGSLPIAASLLALLWLDLPGADSGRWWAVVQARWGHHLTAVDAGSAWLAGLSVVGAVVLARVAAAPRARQTAGLVAVLMGVSAVVAWATAHGWLPSGIARLHPWHWWVAPVLFVVLHLVTLRSEGRAGVLMAGLVLTAGLGGPMVSWRLPAAPLPAALTARLSRLPPHQPLLVHPAESALLRLRARRPLVVTIKDGAEVIGSPVFASRWLRRVEDLCQLSELPQGPGPGWVRFREACSMDPHPEWWEAAAVRFQAAAMCAPDGVELSGWDRVARCARGHWLVATEAAGGETHRIQ